MPPRPLSALSRIGSPTPPQPTCASRPSSLLSSPLGPPRQLFPTCQVGLISWAHLLSLEGETPSPWHPSLSLPSRVRRLGDQALQSSTAWGRGEPYPEQPVQPGRSILRAAGKVPGALETWRDRPSPGAPASPALRPGGSVLGIRDTEPRPYESTRHPVGLRRRLPPPQLLQTGLVSLQGVRDGARGWREKGKSLGGRRAGPAASLSRGSHRAARSLRAWLRLGRVLRRDPRPSPGAPLLFGPGRGVRGGEAAQAGELFREAGASVPARCRV